MRPILLLGLLTGCGNGAALSELDDMRQLWSEAGSEDYAITVQKSCFCPDADPIRVEVVAGEVVSATRRPIDGEDLVLMAADWFTVEGLFAVAEEAIRDADEVEITYDETVGYPSAIGIDWITQAIDDEASYFAADLELR
jgi:hypothetical protein